jgi:uncharacterized membrane protein
MAEEKVKEAKLQVKFEDIKFNEDGKIKAILALIFPIVGLIFLFVEKDDLFVRYYSAVAVVIGLALFVLSIVMSIIPVIGCLSPLLGLGWLIFTIMAVIKANNGEKWQIPTVTEYAVKLMNAV